MAEDDYELMPEKEIKELKKEVELLKKNPLGDSASSKDLFRAVDRLTVSLNNMMDLFKTAKDDMKIGGHDDEMAQALKPISEKIDMLIEQNKKIADGIITVADMVSKRPAEPKKPDMFQPLNRPAPSFGMPPQRAPPMNPPDFAPRGQEMDLPPIEPLPGSPMPPPPNFDAEPEHEKKGFFSKFKK